MKSILLRIKPEDVCKILNGEKTIEIRKKFPENYVGWVYIYCTKEADLVYFKYSDNTYQAFKNYKDWDKSKYDPNDIDTTYNGKGKVVARFWCDKVKEVYWSTISGISGYLAPKYYDCVLGKELIEKSCLTDHQLNAYAFGKNGFHTLFAIPISKLEIFDKPKELSENFVLYNCTKPCDEYKSCKICIGCRNRRINNAPKNYYYIEGEN